MYIKRGLETAHVGNAQLLLQDPKLHRVHFTCVDAKLLMKFSNTQEKQLHHPVIEGSRSPRWTNSNWTVHGCGGPFYPAICLRSWNNSQLSAENYEWEPVYGTKKRGRGNKVLESSKTFKKIWLIKREKELEDRPQTLWRISQVLCRLIYYKIKCTVEISCHKFQGPFLFLRQMEIQYFHLVWRRKGS